MKEDSFFDLELCLTGQHTDLVEPLTELFDIRADHQFYASQYNSSLERMQVYLISELGQLIKRMQVDLVMVQGDTSSCLAGAIAAFNNKVKIAHIESGLRSGNIFRPYPEESYRILTDQISNFRFPPTAIAKSNLESEGQFSNFEPTGNTGIDALEFLLERINSGYIRIENRQLIEICDKASIDKTPLILMTMHRRELDKDTLDALIVAAEKACKNLGAKMIFCLHPNPQIKHHILKHYQHFERIIYLDALPYHEFVYLMDKVHLIISDSGGIQEEASHLGIPLLIVREETERPEALSKQIQLLGYNFDLLEDKIESLLIQDSEELNQEFFGDGNASMRIIEYLKKSM